MMTYLPAHSPPSPRGCPVPAPVATRPLTRPLPPAPTLPRCPSRRRSRPSLVHRCLLLLALFLAGAPARAYAQEPGSLQGTVRDATGAPVPTALVEVQLEGA